MFSGMLLVAIFTQKLLGYDAWTSGLVLAPGGLGNIFSLFASGIVTRVDQRLMLAFGCLLNAVSLYMMTSLTLGMDYWALALPRFIQGFARRVHLRAAVDAHPGHDPARQARERHRGLRHVAQHRRQRRHRGGHDAARPAEPVPPDHAREPHHRVGSGDARAPGSAGRSHFVARGSDAFTAERQAVAMLYRETVAQAQLLAYADDFWLLAVMFAAVPARPAADAAHPDGALDGGHRAGERAHRRARGEGRGRVAAPS